MRADDSRNITESARIGSTESSDGSSLVRVMDFPKIQLAKSSEKFSARNLQMLSIIAEFYHWLHPEFSAIRIEPSNVEIITHFLRSPELVLKVIRPISPNPLGLP